MQILILDPLVSAVQAAEEDCQTADIDLKSTARQYKKQLKTVQTITGTIFLTRATRKFWELRS